MDIITIGAIITIVGVLIIVVGLMIYPNLSLETSNEDVSDTNFNDDDDYDHQADVAPKITEQQRSVFATTPAMDYSQMVVNPLPDSIDLPNEKPTISNYENESHDALMKGIDLDIPSNATGVIRLPLSQCISNPVDVNPNAIIKDVEDYNTNDITGNAIDFVHINEDVNVYPLTKDKVISNVLPDDDVLSKFTRIKEESFEHPIEVSHVVLENENDIDETETEFIPIDDNTTNGSSFTDFMLSDNENVEIKNDNDDLEDLDDKNYFEVV